jgi:hypothetical protein
VKRREELVWLKSSSGADQVGREVNLDGRRGVVVEGSALYITVEFDEPVVVAVQRTFKDRLSTAGRRLLRWLRS